jgi:hypothetical protein
MSVTMEDVLAVLEPEEPNYTNIENLGPECLPHLQSLFRGNDALLASKAAYAASLLPNSAAHDLVLAAAQSDSPSLRAAATGGAGNLPIQAAAFVLVDLLADRDTSVRNKAEAIVAADVADHGGGGGGGGGGGSTLTDLIEAIKRDRAQRGDVSSADLDDRRTGSLADAHRRPGGLMPGEDDPGSENNKDGGTPTASLADTRTASPNPPIAPGLMPGERKVT